MGNCTSAFQRSLAYKANQSIDHDQKHELKADKLKKKLLFLGPGDSGKSTIFKQLVTLYGKGYTDKQRKAYIQNVYGNVMSAIKGLLEASEEIGEQEYQGEILDCSLQTADQKSVEYIDRLTLDAPVTPEGAQHIKILWEDTGIQNTHLLKDTFQFPYDAEYFLNQLDVIAAEDYIPTFEDLIHCRNRTTGILDASLNVNGDTFQIVDVGGQRNERRKWIHCFEGVTGVIFVAAISEYDQYLFEDARKNRMQESLELFDEICNSNWFNNTSLIVFLNKSDLFKKKIQHSPFSKCPLFKSYSGPDPPNKAYDQACQYIKKLFIDKNHSPDRALYLHVTCATDTKNINDVFQDTKDIIMRSCLRISGII